MSLESALLGSHQRETSGLSWFFRAHLAEVLLFTTLKFCQDLSTQEYTDTQTDRNKHIPQHIQHHLTDNFKSVKSLRDDNNNNTITFWK